MKFSSTLEFNAVPEWRSHYIDYDGLKRLIYSLEKASLRRSYPETGVVRSLSSDPEVVFKKALDKELQKVDTFYIELERKLYKDNDKLQNEASLYHRTVAGENLLTSTYRDDPDILEIESSEDESTTLTRGLRPNSLVIEAPSENMKNLAYQKIHLKRCFVAEYVSLNELLSFIDLNRTGFRKALKKFDKTLERELLRAYTADTLNKSYVFLQSTLDALKLRVHKIVESYAAVVCKNDVVSAEETLKGYLREHVVWERNTVWRDMIGMVRESQAIGARIPGEDDHRFKRIRIGSFSVPYLSITGTASRLVLFTIILLLLVSFPLFDSVPQSNCFAIVIYASLLWATETIPLFVTSLLIPVLIVVLRVPLNTDESRMTALEAAEFVFAKMWSPVITTLLGGFTLAAALSKYNIAKVLATTILSRSGTNPRILVLVLMFVAWFMCMWISNVAAPVLLFSVAQPLLRTLPSGHGLGKAIILGIAMASNIGGMGSPIASPQNVIAMQNMFPAVSWLQWFVVAIPVCVLSILLVWALLMMTFPVTIDAANTIGHIHSTNDTFTFVHFYVIGVTVLTILLWCLALSLEKTFGNMGVLAFIPMILLFGPNILSAADFNNFLWTIIALAMGGIALGKSVEACGLLAHIATIIDAKVKDLSLFSICMTLSFMILVIASFVSHTVAALIILPLVRSIGEQLDSPRPRILVMISALMCSAAMALPTSGFPNVTAICMTDELGIPYLTVSDFITRGVPASFIVYLVVVLVGYIISRIISL